MKDINGNVIIKGKEVSSVPTPAVNLDDGRFKFPGDVLSVAIVILA